MSNKLSDGFKPEKSSLSYADLNNETTKNEADGYLKQLPNPQKQTTRRRENDEDELVMHMSSLPGYLERGEKVPEKVLNVGVLDWASLEHWQYSHKHVPHRSSQSSTSSSNTSSSIRSEELSGNSKRGLNWSPQQRIIPPSVRSHFIASTKQDSSIAVKSSAENIGNRLNLRGSHSFDIQRKNVRTVDHLSRNHSTSILKGCDRLEMSTRDDQMEKKKENLPREQNGDITAHDMLGKSKPIVLIIPRDIPQKNNHCGASDMRTTFDQKLGSHSRKTNSVNPKEPSCTYMSCDVSKSRSLLDELSQSRSQPKESRSSSLDSEKFKIPVSTFSAPLPGRMGMSPGRSRKAEERKPSIAGSSSANEPPREAEQKVITDHKVTPEKPRSSSPFRRLSFSMGFTNKVSGCKEVAHVPHQSSIATHKTSSENVRGNASSNIPGSDKPRSSSRSRASPLRRFLDPLVKPKAANCHHSVELSQKDSENARGSDGSNISGNKSSAASKGRSSPLRRLLDPLLKPKAANCHHSMNLFQKETVSTNKNCRSGNGTCSTILPAKELDKDERFGCSTANTVESSSEEAHMPSTSQSILRISMKNGQPLFTFAAGNNSNILAATVKRSTVLKKDECNCIYTFFTFKEIKKKNGSRTNHSEKSKGPDYIRQVIAQMKLSDMHYDDSNSQSRVESTTKEFVLFSVKLKQGDAQVTDYQPNDELAAIAVKSPKAVNYAHQNSSQNECQDLLQLTVVLPSGVHSLPSDGGPSSLIERWKTGGSCDCGGWDLACKLKILANNNQMCRKSRRSEAYFADQYELFFQGNDQCQDSRPVFSFSNFEAGAYSVAFGSSLSPLQAFSICIAMLDGKLPCELSGSRNSIEGTNRRQSQLIQTDDSKDHSKFEGIPANYVAYPPISPAGRV
ncbi:uncharacterized protein LOC131621824 [Vicia villosa]|uniref:uncharacterized protein LOC131621824 n=1 Tax=Vicia villosa TaxID=3911 RepID=UPI00273CCB49|nr:uncharacterized protein LOC131621824 [Vicia villosa]XP_058748846.1 uncharacterized protein LOC131621824 [Vicia villosa]